VLHRLGEGGMGVVYAAYDPELDRKVALKLIRRLPSESDAADDELQARLLREAQAMARVVHSNVVTVHEVARHHDRVFIAMEFVAGETLAVWLARRERSWVEILDAFAHAGFGLAAAHAAGLVHRDFKPNNVMIDESGRVRVMDFGLARPTGKVDAASPSPASRLALMVTASGVLVGTPAYMAPEQMARHPADARSDQFSYCVALYEAVCGTRPFVGADTDELRAAIVEHKLQRPKHKVPTFVLDALERGLSARPEARWPSMTELLAALAADPAGRRWRRVIALAIVGALAAAAFGYGRVTRARAARCAGFEASVNAFWSPTQKQVLERAFAKTGLSYAPTTLATVTRALDRYAASWVAARTDACWATRVLEQQPEDVLAARYECLDKDLSKMREAVEQLSIADAQAVAGAVSTVSDLRSVSECADVPALMHLAAHVRMPSDPAERARLDDWRRRLREIGRLEDAGKYADELRLAQALGRETASVSYAEIRAQAAFYTGGAEIQLEKLEDAERDLKAAALDFTRARDDELAGRAWALLGLALHEDHRSQEALEWMRVAQAEFDRKEAGDYGQAWLAAMMKNVLEANGRHAEALQAAEKALALTRKIEGPDSDQATIQLAELGGLLDDQGAPDKAVPLLQEALAKAERTMGSEHPLVAYMKNNLSAMLMHADRNEEALALLDANMPLFARALPAGTPDAMLAVGARGEALARLGRYSEANGETRRQLAVIEKLLPPTSGDLADPYRVLGIEELGLGRANEAVATLGRSLSLLQAHHSPPTQIAEVRMVLARALEQTGRHDRARAEAKLAADAYRDAASALGGRFVKQRDEATGWLDAHPE
jgi:tetratricopeptide (TPR) repeat protein